MKVLKFNHVAGWVGTLGSAPAFTLSEVLITLGIIGIVAALTMPSLIQKHKEQEIVVKLKKFSSVMSQALTMAVQNEGEIPNWGLGKSGTGLEESDDELANSALAKKKFLDIITKYLKYTEYHPIDSEATIYDRYTLDGTKFDFFAKRVVLPDGISIVGATILSPDCKQVRGASRALQNICGELFVDINGKKGPNATGKDVFLFYYNRFGQLIPVGSAADTVFTFEQLCNKSKTNNLNGYGCTAWVMYNENMDYLHCDDLSWNGKYKCK